MPKETMTPRERWEAVLKRQIPDRIPMDFWSTEETLTKLKKHFHCETRSEVLKKLRVDFTLLVGPSYIGPSLPPQTNTFGVRYKDIDYGTGVYSEAENHPLAGYKSVAEIKQNYQFPNPEWYDYSGIAAQTKGFEEYAITGGGSEPLLIYKELRGDEQALLDMVQNPEIIHYCLDILFDLAYKNTQRIFEAIPGKVTVTYVAEDMGGQTNLMFSPTHIREFLLPGMKRMIDLAHSAGAYAFHHNDGNCLKILPEMIDLGINIFNPIQWRAYPIDRQTLKDKFGDKIVFHGAVDNQFTLPFGTVKDVQEEVLENIRILGKNGGYILAPCHNIQPLTPIENILTMYETAYEAGWY